MSDSIVPDQATRDKFRKIWQEIIRNCEDPKYRELIAYAGGLERYVQKLEPEVLRLQQEVVNRNQYKINEEALKNVHKHYEEETKTLGLKIKDLQMILRRVCVARSEDVRNKILEQCAHLFKGSPLRSDVE
jgi:hypothetical protein